jgi:hypothetical protein
MKKFIVVTSSLLLSISAIANESERLKLEDGLNQTSIVAPQETVKAVTETCQSWAKEVGVERTELASYLLDCVNDELQERGFLPVSKISE